MNKEVSDYLDKANEHHREILTQLRSLIISVAPDANEQFKWGRPVYGRDKDFCYLQTTKKHVTLGFFEFDKIITNTHLIEGSGKSMRHVKLTSVGDINDFLIKDMIEDVLQ